MKLSETIVKLGKVDRKLQALKVRRASLDTEISGLENCRAKFLQDLAGSTPSPSTMVQGT